MKNWMYDGSSRVEPVISSRIRIARNLSGEAFPHLLSEEQGRRFIDRVQEAFYASNSNGEDFKTIKLWEEDRNSINSYLEKHLISPNLIKVYNKAAFILNRQETVSIMINEEDHLRIQCINSGFNLRETYQVANSLDSFLEEKLSFAFNENLGYLTACPTNLGTGIRASVMIHLPALTMNKEMTQVLKALTQVGMTIRGLYGEGSSADGNIYQVSNQVTLGISEEEILFNLEAAISEILQQESRARAILLKNYPFEMQDKIFRSLAILKSARVLSSKECLDLLSNVRLGLELSLIDGIDGSTINSLLVNTQPATLQKNIARKLTDLERDVERAKYVRQILNAVKK